MLVLANKIVSQARPGLLPLVMQSSQACLPSLLAQLGLSSEGKIKAGKYTWQGSQSKYGHHAEREKVEIK